jgi:carboxylate-amine ligase
MDVRTVGIEEELLLVDPRTRALSDRSHEVLRDHHARRGGKGPHPASQDLEAELFRHQLETRTDPTRDLEEAEAQLVAARGTAGRAARDHDLAAIASGTAPFGEHPPRVTSSDRYRAMVDRYGEITRTAGTCGMHVHVAISSDEEGVGVIDRIAPWLPTLLAMSANSPYFAGRDTHHLSWRSQLWAQWPSAGRHEAFGSLAGYREVRRLLLATGAARDDAMLYFDARLSVNQPTVEVRVFDVCAEPRDAVLVAALVRALVTHEAAAWAAAEPAPSWRAEVLRAAHWRAARFGLTGSLLHPTHRELRPSREILEDLVSLVRVELEAAGDLDRVEHGVERVLQNTGATRQHAAFERAHSVEAVVDDLVARSEAVWADRATPTLPAP